MDRLALPDREKILGEAESAALRNTQQSNEKKEILQTNDMKQFELEVGVDTSDFKEYLQTEHGIGIFADVGTDRMTPVKTKRKRIQVELIKHA